MNLFDILACPGCRGDLEIRSSACICSECRQSYPIVRGVPLFLSDPDGTGPPQNQTELIVRTDYDPWIPKTVLHSLGKDQIILEVGCGNRALSIPNVIRMDIALTPYVDVVADIHALPFKPESLDFIFSMAVVEHLRDPFRAARSMHAALKDGGYIYHECNFVFTYHGSPCHFFNATAEGMKAIFSAFSIIRQGVAPYQMPSFALKNVLESYIHHSRAAESPQGLRVIRQLKEILDLDLLPLDGYFSEEGALNLAAGTYLVAQKKESPRSTLIPPVLFRHWQTLPELQERFSEVDRIHLPDNILIWAQGEGRARFPDIEAYFTGVIPFNKDPEAGRIPPPAYRPQAEEQTAAAPGTGDNNPGNRHPEVSDENRLFPSLRAGWTILSKEGFRIFLGKLLRSWSRKLLY
jgi:SAM-dependent methyltransferase